MRTILILTILISVIYVNGQENKIDMKENDNTAETNKQWKQKLTEVEFNILRNCGTEPPFSGKYYKHKEEGTYHCAGCGAKLFSSDTKYDSGSGWPSFYAAIDKETIKEVEDKLDDLATKIHDSRAKVIPDLKKKLEQFLTDLAMENTKFQFNLTKGETFFTNGKDELNLLFSANKGSSFESLKKVASGGEMSRIMLSVKALLSEYSSLPTILFDEIDTGVSGEVSNKMAAIMKNMSENMQVISITHLPQIAAKGNHHFKVFKEDIATKTITNVKQLNANERVSELAEMLGGKDLADSAIEHAKQLLG